MSALTAEFQTWEILTGLGVPGVALGVFYFLMRRIRWTVRPIPTKWAAPSFILFLLLVTSVTVYALAVWSPSQKLNSEVSIDPTSETKLFQQVLFKSLLELQENQFYLRKLNPTRNGSLNHYPPGNTSFDETLSLLKEHYNIALKDSYGEEKNIYSLVHLGQSISKSLNEIRNREELIRWNKKFEMTIDDLRFLSGFLRYYLDRFVDEYSDGPWKGALYVPRKYFNKNSSEGVELRFFRDYDDNPVTDYGMWLGLID